MLDELLSYYPELEYIESDNYVSLPSICHNLDIAHPDKNLKLYKNNGLFHCFSQCQQSFNLWQLLKKREKLENRVLIGTRAPAFAPQLNQDLFSDTLRRIQQRASLSLALPQLSPSLLETYMPANEQHPWFVEGVDLEVLHRFRVGFSKPDNAVIIPHFDIAGRLIGIRRRAYNPSPNKYMPWFWNGQMLTHPLGNNLYGANINLPSIRHTGVVYIAEGEKSVLQAATFGVHNVVATCGFNLSAHQTTLIQRHLQPNIVIVAYDKEYSTAATQADYFATIKKNFEKLARYCDVYVLIDVYGAFAPKESPFDKTINDFNNLEKWKI